MTVEELKNRKKELQEELSKISTEIKKLQCENLWTDSIKSNSNFLSKYKRISEDIWERLVTLPTGDTYVIRLSVNYGRSWDIDCRLPVIDVIYKSNLPIIQHLVKDSRIYTEEQLEKFLNIESPLSMFRVKYEGEFLSNYDNISSIKEDYYLEDAVLDSNLSNPKIDITKVE